ncbi:hypothetical protein KDK88_03030 [bacterium]|nr:hypothetical protein [bacterium]HPF34657.1 hypothetical protein [Candidatus Krumholzibacteria bacterium]HRX51026.1 hypothetical protein [Candidatus Krumholzibacteria bacterium]
MMQQNDPRLSQTSPPASAPYVSRRDLPLKSPALAVFLSLLPGLGQAYVGHYRQAFLSVLVFGATIALLSSGDVRGLEPLLGVFIVFFFFFQMIDASRKASLYNQLLERGETMDPVQDLLPDTGGGLVFGGAMVLVGVLALLHNVFDVSMEWIGDWWPLVLVATGGWLVWRARQEKAKRG